MIYPRTRKGLYDWYFNELKDSILPFWERHVDRDFGGVINCLDNEGRNILSYDKYTWSQGRFLWEISRLVFLVNEGILKDSIVSDMTQLVEDCHKCAVFCRDHALLPNDHVSFLLTRDGHPKEAFKGVGLEASWYADCFVALGFAQYAATFRNRFYAMLSKSLFDEIALRYDSRSIHTSPYPIPKGCWMHGVVMFAMHTASVVAMALSSCGLKDDAWHVKKKAKLYAQELESNHYRPPFVRELSGPSSMDGTMLFRHMTPGHALEGIWFYLHLMEDLDLGDSKFELASSLARQAMEKGWDKEFGGLLHFVDGIEGGRPRGDLVGEPYEKTLQSWDAKLWWVHSEALYATALLAKETGDSFWQEQNEKVFQYTFSTFPNPDKEVGEWIQIRRRDGSPMNEFVALPLKDPYHIVRNFLYLEELYA